MFSFYSLVRDRIRNRHCNSVISLSILIILMVYLFKVNWYPIWYKLNSITVCWEVTEQSYDKVLGEPQFSRKK